MQKTTYIRTGRQEVGCRRTGLNRGYVKWTTLKINVIVDRGKGHAGSMVTGSDAQFFPVEIITYVI